jgi:hypothetical protein
MERLATVLPERRPDPDAAVRLIAAYWKALGKMNIDVFEATVDRACETLERFPRPATLWTLSREVKRLQPVHQETPAYGDFLWGFAQRALFQWLLRRVATHGKLPEDRLQAVIAEKNAQLAFLRALIGDGDPEATPERFILHFERRANQVADVRAAA